jgi:hypothetical protein
MTTCQEKWKICTMSKIDPEDAARVGTPLPASITRLLPNDTRHPCHLTGLVVNLHGISSTDAPHAA